MSCAQIVLTDVVFVADLGTEDSCTYRASSAILHVLNRSDQPPHIHCIDEERKMNCVYYSRTSQKETDNNRDDKRKGITSFRANDDERVAERMSVYVSKRTMTTTW